jgi:hypothetical protein
MAFFEVSPLCDFNIRESFSELSRMALHRNGMERLWRSNKGMDKACANHLIRIYMASKKINESITVSPVNWAKMN